MSYAVRIPATTSNFGPGFDCLGAALCCYNRVCLEDDDAPSGEKHPMVEGAAQAFREATGSPHRPFRWSIAGEVPVSRGLGSSVTLRLGILATLNLRAGEPLGRDALFALCSALEKHPDNAGPAVYGGFFVGGANGRHFRFPIAPELRFVILVPTRQVLTEAAREVLPDRIAWKDAVANVGNAAAITAAFASGNYEALRGLFSDYLHEPYREALNPGLKEMIAAGVEVGAFGGFLSGSGSAVACLAETACAEAVGRAMKVACADPGAEVRILPADNEGFVRDPN